MTISDTLAVPAGMLMAACMVLAVSACPSIDRDKSNDPGPADGGETGAPADPDAETEALKAELVEAKSARMSCEAELAECRAAPEK